MESQHPDPNGQHQTQQLQHQQQDLDLQDQHDHQTQPTSRGPRKGSSRPRGSSRTRRLSSSSFTDVVNFDEPSASAAGPHARTPANRGRGRDATSSSTSSHSHSRSHSHSKSQLEIFNPIVASEILSPLPPAMQSNHDDDGGAPRPDKASSKQQSPQHHSFSFATPQNPRNTPGRKRARTLEYPQTTTTTTGSHSPGDDAKVKGGHSLRKRARIDYAQMNEHEDDDQQHAPTHATEGLMEITVSGARSVRKRRATADPNYEEEEIQPSTLPPPKKKPRTVEKQRTVSPVPQRRPYQKRKSTVAATITLESPDQQPSDTELKDTIEVGAPLAMHMNSSSSQTHSSETASNVSGQSPSQNINIPQADASHRETVPTKTLPIANGSATDSDRKDVSGAPVQEKPQAANDALPQATEPGHSPPTELAKTSENGVDSPKLDAPKETPAPNQNGNDPRSQKSTIATANDINPQVGHEVEHHDRHHTTLSPSLQTSNIPRAVSEAAQSTHQPSSQESMDSDTTEIVAPSLIPTATSTAMEPSVGERSGMASKGKGKQPAVEAHAPQEEPAEVKQDAPKLGLRPRVSSDHETFGHNTNEMNLC